MLCAPTRPEAAEPKVGVDGNGPEQSENVYENKGSLFLAGADVAFERLRSPAPEQRRSVRLYRLPSPVPSGHRRPHTSGVCANPPERGELFAGKVKSFILIVSASVANFNGKLSHRVFSCSRKANSRTNAISLY